MRALKKHIRANAWILPAVMAAMLSGCPPTGPGQPTVNDVRQVLPGAEALTAAAPPGADAQAGVRVLLVQTAGRTVGYVIDIDAAARSGRFTMRVVLDASAVVLRCEVISYSGDRGRDIQQPAFVRQFEGRGPADAKGPGRRVDAVSGATLSSNAAAKAIRQAIDLAARLR